MGKLNQGPFQGFIGKTGGLVGKRWKGKYVVSAYQPNVNNPKSSNQQLQRGFFAQAVSLVKEFFSGTIRNSLSTGWIGITLIASNIGAAVRAIRIKYFSENGIELKQPLSLKAGSLTSGLSDFGNNILDLFYIAQTGTTSTCTVNVRTTPGNRYFGSDIDLTGLRMVQMSNTNGNIMFNDLDLGLTSQIVNTTIEKTFGFKDTADDCGNWPFVYKIQTSVLATFELEALNLRVQGSTINQAFANIGWFVPNSTVFTSKFLTENITVAP